MSNAKREFFNEEVYHIFNRGVEKRIIFLDESDYYRFVFSLYECNDSNTVHMAHRIFTRRQRSKANGTRFHLVPLDGEGKEKTNLPDIRIFQTKRDPLVEIVAFVLMPNHYHLVLRQLVDGGISLFMKKLSNSYTGYFNERHKRKGMGALFQGAFKSVRVGANNQFLHLIEYIFSNPVEIIDSNWKIAGVQDSQKAIEFLNSYKWSSYLDSIGQKNFPSVSARHFLWKVFGGSTGIEEGMRIVQRFTEEWIKNKKTLASSLSLE